MHGALIPEDSLWLLAGNKRLLDTNRLVCHGFSKNIDKNSSNNISILYWHHHNPSQILSNEQKKPPMKFGSWSKFIYVWRYNDVLRKKIITPLPKNQTVFAFSSWLSLILILWLFSDHIQMGILRAEMRWRMVQIYLKLFMTISAATLVRESCPRSDIIMCCRSLIFLSNCDWSA